MNIKKRGKEKTWEETLEGKSKEWKVGFVNGVVWGMDVARMLAYNSVGRTLTELNRANDEIPTQK